MCNISRFKNRYLSVSIEKAYVLGLTYFVENVKSDGIIK